MILSHLPSRAAEQYRDTQYSWVTKFDLYTRFSAYTSPDAKRFCDKQMQGAKTRPHPNPQHKKDPDFTLYRILNTVLEVRGKISIQA